MRAEVIEYMEKATGGGDTKDLEVEGKALSTNRKEGSNKLVDHRDSFEHAHRARAHKFLRSGRRHRGPGPNPH